MRVIYQILNMVTGRRYVGQTIDYAVRLRQHRLMLRSRKHWNVHLQGSWLKHGEAAFEFSVLEECDSATSLVEREQFWIDTFGMDNLYNLSPSAASPEGVKWSAEARRRSSEARKGKVVPWLVAANMGNSYGKANGGKRRPQTSERQRGKPTPWLVAANKARVQSKEEREKRAAFFRGRPNPQVAAAGRRRMTFTMDTKREILRLATGDVFSERGGRRWLAKIYGVSVVTIYRSIRDAQPGRHAVHKQHKHPYPVDLAGDR